MAEYIEREALLEKVRELSNTYSYCGLASVHMIKAIEDAPKVDVVEVVRCKSCEYCRKVDDRDICISFACSKYLVDKDYSCGKGLKKEGVEE